MLLGFTPSLKPVIMLTCRKDHLNPTKSEIVNGNPFKDVIISPAVTISSVNKPTLDKENKKALIKVKNEKKMVLMSQKNFENGLPKLIKAKVTKKKIKNKLQKPIKKVEATEPEFCVTRQGNPMMVLSGYRFSQQRKQKALDPNNKTKQRWVCTSQGGKQCKSRVYTLNNVIVESIGKHNHAPRRWDGKCNR